MRIAKAVAIASLCVTALVSAQMKKPSTTTPTGTAISPAAKPIIDSARRITRQDATRLVREGKAVYVDVRSKDQYDLGHIKGAISIPGSQIITRLREVAAGKMIITYCA